MSCNLQCAKKWFGVVSSFNISTHTKLGMLFSKFEACIVIETNGMGLTNEPHDTSYTNSKSVRNYQHKFKGVVDFGTNLEVL